MAIFYVTKYALTAGIKEVETTEPERGMLYLPGKYTEFYHGEGRDWHRTLEAAVARAEQMRMDKIVSLEKQIRKLQTKVFAAARRAG